MSITIQPPPMDPWAPGVRGADVPVVSDEFETTSAAPDELTALRLRLRSNGYHPVPVVGAHIPTNSAGKRPTMVAWERECLNATPEKIASWARSQPECTNTGLLCGEIVGVDVDVLDATLSADIVARALELFGPSPLRRIGRAPKTLLLYRVETPHQKLSTPDLIFGDDPENKDAKAKVEILADGQQCVGFGIHPDTRAPYHWPERSPLDIAVSEVPLVTLDALQQFVTEAGQTLRAAGGRTAREIKDRNKQTETRNRDGGMFAGLRDFDKPSHEVVADALDHIPNDMDYDEWIRIGFALYDGLGESGRDLWESWSARCHKNDPHLTASKWPSFAKGKSIKIGTLFWLAKEHGWRRSSASGSRYQSGPRSEEESGPRSEQSSAGGSRHQSGPRSERGIPNDVPSHDSVATEFVVNRGEDLKFCYSSGFWYRWNSVMWVKDDTARAFHWVREFCRKLSDDQDGSKRAKMQSTAFADGVERFARGDPQMAVTADYWDRDSLLLGTPGGTVDLTTGALRKPDRSDRITMSTSVTPLPNPCPRWLQFLHETAGGDEEMIRFLQQWCGYSLTGLTNEHALVFVYGTGGNGKSVFLNTVASILHDYAATAAMDTFVASRNDRHPTDLAKLRGARLVTASETEEGRAWAESRIKQLTGGDKISARFMRQDFFEYVPQFKLMIVGNHKPVLQNVDEAARRRFSIVPFIRKPATPDRDLEKKLKQEAEGILHWMIAGCLDWQENGLSQPASVRAATDAYFNDQDVFGQWIEDECDTAPGNTKIWDTSRNLFESWTDYATKAGEPPGKQKAFAEAMRRRGLEPYRANGGTRAYRFVRVRVP